MSSPDLPFEPVPVLHGSMAGHLAHRVAACGFEGAGHVLLPMLADVQMNPSTGALPGGNVLQNLMDGLGGWALALALIGLVIGAAAWALGSHGQNYQQSYVGRRAVLISGLAALIIGAGPAIVNFFFHAGQSVHSVP